jgi:hypothetical protein
MLLGKEMDYSSFLDQDFPDEGSGIRDFKAFLGQGFIFFKEVKNGLRTGRAP